MPLCFSFSRPLPACATFMLSVCGSFLRPFSSCLHARVIMQRCRCAAPVSCFCPLASRHNRSVNLVNCLVYLRPIMECLLVCEQQELSSCNAAITPQAPCCGALHLGIAEHFEPPRLNSIQPPCIAICLITTRGAKLVCSSSQLQGLPAQLCWVEVRHVVVPSGNVTTPLIC